MSKPSAWRRKQDHTAFFWQPRGAKMSVPSPRFRSRAPSCRFIHSIPIHLRNFATNPSIKSREDHEICRNKTILTALFVALIHLTAFGFYDPSLQRWINRDPLGESGFETIREYTVSHSTDRIRSLTEAREGPNKYVFLRNRPVDRIDPLGQQAFPVNSLPGAHIPRCGPLTCKQMLHNCYIRAATICIGVGILTETGPIGGGACFAILAEYCYEKYHDSCVDGEVSPYYKEGGPL